MRLNDVLRIIKSNFIMGSIVVLFFTIIALLGYFLIYKKILKGKKNLTLRQVLPVILITGYILMVFGVTFLSRGYGWKVVNLHLFSSYREAWNTFTLRSWQFIIFNIIMFVPLGILLPLFYDKFRKSYLTIGMGVIFTLVIEFIQLLTGLGIFELDDIFNNILGTIIGYSIIMIILTLLKEKRGRLRKIVSYSLPIVITIAVFVGIFIKYNINEFGNLQEAYSYKLDLSNTEISIERDLGDKQTKAIVYKAPEYNKDTALEFAKDFFVNLGLDPSKIEINAYNKSAQYSITDKDTYLIWFDYLDGTYRYIYDSIHDNDMTPKNIDEMDLYKELEKYNIHIPEIAKMESTEKGQYQWTVEKYKKDDILIDGSIYCNYYNDDTIKSISNNLVTYKKVREVNIISEKEAYERLRNGEFKTGIRDDSINSISVRDIKIDYSLDSKGFYQPVYIFEALINGENHQIPIPAI